MTYRNTSFKFAKVRLKCENICIQKSAVSIEARKNVPTPSQALKSLGKPPKCHCKPRKMSLSMPWIFLRRPHTPIKICRSAPPPPGSQCQNRVNQRMYQVPLQTSTNYERGIRVVTSYVHVNNNFGALNCLTWRRTDIANHWCKLLQKWICKAMMSHAIWLDHIPTSA